MRYDAIAITDEIYEHILYDGAVHVPIATLAGHGAIARSRSARCPRRTRSRAGAWAGRSRRRALMAGIRPVHDFLTVAAAAPLQVAGITALALPPAYYEETAAGVRRAPRRDDADPRRHRVRGAAARGRVLRDGRRVAPRARATTSRPPQHLVEEVGVATVPGSSFFSRPADGSHLLRFAFCKQLETLEAAGERLRTLVQ